jgi:hypothetical protein
MVLGSAPPKQADSISALHPAARSRFPQLIPVAAAKERQAGEVRRHSETPCRFRSFAERAGPLEKPSERGLKRGFLRPPDFAHVVA